MKDQKLIDEQIQLLLKHKIIQPPSSPYSAPISLVNKKDEGEKSRLVVDYRALNKITIPDSFPFPRIEDIIDKLHGSKIFSVIDISSGFFHIKVRPQDVSKTAFATQFNLYEFLCAPFGFRNSPAIFCRAIYRLLRKHNLTNFTHSYMDDILIHSKNFEQHLLHLRQVFQVLRQENVKVKLSKCHFGQNSVQYIGHIISENEIRPMNDHIIAVKNFPIPMNKKCLQQLLGKINYNRKFIPDASRKLNPLFELLKNDKKFEWDKNC